MGACESHIQNIIGKKSPQKNLRKTMSQDLYRQRDKIERDQLQAVTNFYFNIIKPPTSKRAAISLVLQKKKQIELYYINKKP